MLKVINAASLEELIAQTIPSSIRLNNELSLPAAKSEYQFLQDFKKGRIA
jgi:glycine dehydrogenase